jgi:toxin YoeB
MQIEFKGTSFDDFKFWIKNDNRKALIIVELLSDIEKNPFSGKGNPESLKYQLSGLWSRRIDQEHRLVYSFTN